MPCIFQASCVVCAARNISHLFCLRKRRLQVRSKVSRESSMLLFLASPSSASFKSQIIINPFIALRKWVLMPALKQRKNLHSKKTRKLPIIFLLADSYLSLVGAWSIDCLHSFSCQFFLIFRVKKRKIKNLVNFAFANEPRFQFRIRKLLGYTSVRTKSLKWLGRSVRAYTWELRAKQSNSATFWYQQNRLVMVCLILVSIPIFNVSTPENGECT
jgi:hypothetical protein